MFDPLAVVLIVAFNTALKVDRGIVDKKKVVEHRVLYGEEDVKEIEVIDEEIIIVPTDLNADGIITTEEQRQHYDSTEWRNAYQGKSYFYHPWFDWKKTERWVNNPEASRYWLDYRGGNSKILDDYKNKLR